jgi:hypothetical protein
VSQVSSRLRPIGLSIASVGAVILVAAAVVVLLSWRATSLVTTTTIGAYGGLGLVALGLIGAAVAPPSSDG